MPILNPESMLKGRMAETLVEELLKTSGNRVYRFGYEAIVQNLVQIKDEFDKNTEVGQRIRAIPDFIVIDKKGNSSFLEVKFRWDGNFINDDIRRFEWISKYWNSPVVLVNCKERPYFRITYPPYHGADNKIADRPLIDITEWAINSEAYKLSEQLVEKYLTPTMR